MNLKPVRLLQFSFFAVIVTLIGTFMLYYDFHKDDVKTYQAVLAENNSQEFSEFLYENRGKFVHLSIVLNEQMKKDVLKGMDKDGRIVFRAPINQDEKKLTTYIIRLPDDGREDFSFDKTSGKLEGYFKTYKRKAKDGTDLINLVPIKEAWLPKVDGIVKQG